MGNKAPRNVRPSKNEATSDSVDVIKGRLLCVEVVLTCDQNAEKCTVPCETKFILTTNGECHMYYKMYIITIHCYRE